MGGHRLLRWINTCSSSIDVLKHSEQKQLREEKYLFGSQFRLWDNSH